MRTYNNNNIYLYKYSSFYVQRKYTGRTETVVIGRVLQTDFVHI